MNEPRPRPRLVPMERVIATWNARSSLVGSAMRRLGFSRTARNSSEAPAPRAWAAWASIRAGAAPPHATGVQDGDYIGAVTPTIEVAVSGASTLAGVGVM